MEAEVDQCQVAIIDELLVYYYQCVVCLLFFKIIFSNCICIPQYRQLFHFNSDVFEHINADRKILERQ